MTYNLQHAVVYDVETLPNVFTLTAHGLFLDFKVVFQISPFRDDRVSLFQWFNYWHHNQIPMIGFNNLLFDYPVLHRIYGDMYISEWEIYDYAMSIIRSGDRFGSMVWQSDRFAPQIDLMKIHHFDNPAKMTSLKALEVNMRSPNVLEMPLPFDQPLTAEQIERVLIPYNDHDVAETKRFAHISMSAMEFRAGLVDQIRGDVMNFSDTKIGSKILEGRLGDELCYSRETGSRRPRQTPRESIPLRDVIFPYVQFRHPEFNRVLTWMRDQVLTADELTGNLRTKGAFTGVHASVGGIDFHFGTGGIHGSVAAQRFQETAETAIVDIDVTGLYPSIAIVNRLYPEHLGERFVEEYSRLPIERKKHKKGTVQNASLKLAANGTYGNSNNKHSVFFDPKFTMAITINGQLLLCMLAEALLQVPTLEFIQINTDGITYRVNRRLMDYARLVQSKWEATTRLVLEEAYYRRMWIRDVNNYVAEDLDGKLKMKGAYWFPRVFPDDMNTGAPAWHKDLSALVVVRAAVEHMVHGTAVADYVHGHGDMFDFMLRAKVDRSSQLYIGDREVQRTTRYFMSASGEPMRKISPPKGPPGEYKRKNKISDLEYHNIRQEIGPGVWDERIHTKNKAKYTTRETGIRSGFRVAECNHVDDFDFARLDYYWYIREAEKLVIT